MGFLFDEFLRYLTIIFSVMRTISIKEELHKNYIRYKGRFEIDCNTIIFSSEEIEMLEKWGHWYHALCNGDVELYSEKQRRFAQTANGEREPFSIEEQVWNKYLGRKKVEAKLGDKLEYNYVPEADNFFSRDLNKNQQLLIFK